MAPKKHHQDEPVIQSEEQHAMQKESERLAKKAQEVGLLSDLKLHGSPLPISKSLSRANQQDILKKSTTRKGRYLILINVRLAPAAAGKLGSLSHLDSQNPVMYIDLPQGRLKLLGTLIHPQSKYMVLKPQSGSMLCEDVFETIVVFSEVWWVGTKDENPNENRLPMPRSLNAAEKQHKTFHFNHGAQRKEGEGLSAVSSKRSSANPEGSKREGRRASAGKSYAGDGDDKDEFDSGDDVEDQDEEEEEEKEKALPSANHKRDRPAARRASAAKKRYKEDSDSDEIEEENSDESDDALPAKKAKTSGAGAKAKAAKPKSKETVSIVIDDSQDIDEKPKRKQPVKKPPLVNLIEESDDDEPEVKKRVLASNAKKLLASASKKMATGTKARRSKAEESEEEDGEDSEEEDDSEMGEEVEDESEMEEDDDYNEDDSD